MSADELLTAAEASASDVTQRLAAKIRRLLGQLEERVEVEEKKATIARLTAELAAARSGKRRPAPRPMTTATAAECVRLYAEGLTIAEVGERLDRPWSTVRKALLDAGVELRPQGRIPRRGGL